MGQKLMKGAFCEIVTSFHADGSVDYEGFQKMLEYQLACGIDGFFINGEGAESLQLTNEERIRIAELSCSCVKGRVPIIGGIVLSSRLQAIELMEAYNSLGSISAICAVPPMMVPLAENALYDYFALLACTTKKPVQIYNQPTTGNLLSEKLILRLAGDFENISGYKDATQNIIMLQNLIAKMKRPFEFFAGSDAFIWPMAALGCLCVISLVAVAFPKPVVEFYRLWEQGKYEKAYKQNLEILKMRQVLKEGFPPGSKAGYLYATELVDVPIQGTRLPISYLDITDAQRTYIKEQAKLVGWI
jgi:4-hydroxy-tetrahydrodipicolinate synthase